MDYPQIVVYERESLLVKLVRPLAEARRWFVREPRRLESCVKLLSGHPGVLIVRPGPNPLGEMKVLAETRARCPDAGIIAVCDVDQQALVGEAWHLGADFVLRAPQLREWLPEIASALMERAGARRRQAGGDAGPAARAGEES